MHRIEASNPPPPPSSAAVGQHSESAIPGSEGPSPTTASIAAEEPEERPVWLNFAAFGVALLLALSLGWWLTARTPAPATNAVPSATAIEPKRSEPVTVAPTPPAPLAADTARAEPEGAVNARPAPAAPKARTDVSLSPAAPAAAVPPAQSPAARKPAPAKSTRETIF
jgi:hypothetical protein